MMKNPEHDFKRTELCQNIYGTVLQRKPTYTITQKLAKYGKKLVIQGKFSIYLNIVQNDIRKIKKIPTANEI